MSSPPNSYDDVPYPSYAYWYTAPDTLCTLARIFGVGAEDVTRCRVLELGCGTGGNLIPMAFREPGSTFVGIDASRGQIEAAQAASDALGLGNIEWRVADLGQGGPDIGQFDYILCHGVYSWVSDLVRQQILGLCSDRLAPAGVAAISFNVLPAWHMGQSLRSSLRHFAGQGPAPERIGRAWAGLDALIATIGEDDPRRAFLLKEAGQVRRRGDGYLFHEYLAEQNQAFTLTEVVDAAGTHGLAYLCDADRTSVFMGNQPPEVVQLLAGCTNPVEAQQRLDHLTHRRFRCGLFHREGLTLQLDLQPSVVEPLWIRGAVTPDPAKGGLRDDRPTTVTTPYGISAQVDGPALRVALSLLSAQSPRAMPVVTLLDRVIEGLEAGGEHDLVATPTRRRKQRSDVLAHLTRLYFGDVIHLHSHGAAVCGGDIADGTVSPVARWEAGRGAIVTNQWHEAVTCDWAEKLASGTELDAQQRQWLLENALLVPGGA